MEVKTQDKYQKSRSDRLNQKIKILINRPDFQKDIFFLRKKWKIPQGGVKTEKENKDWNIWILNETDTYCRKKWPKVDQKIQSLIGLKRYKEAEEMKNLANNEAPLNAFNNDAWIIVINFDLSAKWYEGVKDYLLSNNPKCLCTQTGVNVNFRWDHGVVISSIEFDQDTTLSDLKKAWSWIRKTYYGKHLHKFQPIKNFDRDKRVYELEKEGKDWKEIAEIIEKEFNNDLGYNEINIAINRYKKRLHINQA